jgi:transposase
VFPNAFLPDAKLEIVAVEQDTANATIQLRVRHRATGGNCPTCGQYSQSVHSGYERKLKDLPCSGFAVGFIVEVRRFLCKAAACPRTTFSERLPEVTQPYARQSNRLRVLVETMALLVGSAMGKCLLGPLRIPASIWSILRLLRKPSDTAYFRSR